MPYSHSKDYKNPEGFKGKRVIVVGGDESGSDVAYGISKVAEQCWVSLLESKEWIVPRKRGDHAVDVSTHRGIWGLPREYWQYLSPFVLKLEGGRKDPVFDALADLNEKVSSKNGIWGILGTKTLALPKAIAHHGCVVVGDITDVVDGGKTLQATDGSFLENIGTIVFSTGYRNRVDFMPKEFQTCDPREMFKNIFHLNLGKRMAWVGWAPPGFGSQFPIMEMQARYCSEVFKDHLELPEPEEMKRISKDDFSIYKNQFEENAVCIRSLIGYHRYMDIFS